MGVYVINKKWLRPIISLSIVGIAIVISMLIYKNNYLDYAPDFETTIYHGNLKDHLSATTEMKDVSGGKNIPLVAAVK